MRVSGMAAIAFVKEELYLHNIFRMSGLHRLCSLAVILLLASTASAAAAESLNGPSVRVGLMTRQFNFMVTSNVQYEAVEIDSGKVLGDFAADVKSRIGLRDGQIVINNTVANGTGLTIRPKNNGKIERAERTIDLNNRRYLGIVEIVHTPVKGGLTAINILPVDDYVYSLMVKDLSPEWPVEALKAQAVATRTFALH